MPTISVIVPVYKVRDELPRCLDSLLAQTFPDWEALCVDDGSPDDCPAILESYAAKDSRFIVIHKENGGLSSARNAAIARVRGPYVLYLDSDDFLHPQTMEICLHMALRDNSDLVAFTYHHPYRTISTILRRKKPVPLKHYRTYRIDRIKSLTVTNIFDWATNHSRTHRPADERRWIVKHSQVWRCLYKYEIVKDLRFIEGIIYEDFPWWGEVLLNVRRATVINLPLYYYYPNFSGIVKSSALGRRIGSLKTAIAASEKTFAERATPAQREKWNLNFLETYRGMLRRKEAKYARRFAKGRNKQYFCPLEF